MWLKDRLEKRHIYPHVNINPSQYVSQFRIEFLNIIMSKSNCKKVGIILDGIIGSSDPEVLVDQASDLSSAKETVLLLGLLFLQTDPSFEVGIMDDFVQC